jgi:hypothetical protein
MTHQHTGQGVRPTSFMPCLLVLILCIVFVTSSWEFVDESFVSSERAARRLSVVSFFFLVRGTDPMRLNVFLPRRRRCHRHRLLGQTVQLMLAMGKQRKREREQSNEVTLK